MDAKGLYMALCREAGTLTDADASADEWWDECGHNRTPDLEATLTRAAAGDAAALVEARTACGLDPLIAGVRPD